MKTILVLLVTITSASAQQAVIKSGQCPAGYSSGASYCTPMSGTAKQAIPKVGQCPGNMIQSGNYCISK